MKKTVIPLFMLGLMLAGMATIGTAKAAETTDQLLIRKELNDGCADFVSGKTDAAIAFYLPSVMVFDVAPPRQKTYQMVNNFNKGLRALVVGTPVCVYEDIEPVILTSEYAYSTSILLTSGKLKGGAVFRFRERSTDIYQKVDGMWRVMHEHNSVPVNVLTGKADLLSTP